MLITLVCFIVLGPAAEGSTLVLRGAGASFPREVYDAWTMAYQQKRSKHISLEIRYESIGSGGGKARIEADEDTNIHFAGSDSPLSEAERLQHPDLAMVPTLVGAIVMAYRLPGVEQLSLSLEAVTGMYNGSIQRWTDPIITALNPGKSLPDAPIIVVSRSDKSGTTEAFTRGLSVYSSEWETEYGVFSVGLDDDGVPIKWNSRVIKYFGFTNRGMNGLILSLKYSVGYMSIADVNAFDMAYANMKNRDGQIVGVNISTMQSVILNANKTFDLMNLPGHLSFPLATYTYFIVNIRSNFACGAMVELVRFMHWFYTSDEAKEAALKHSFTPLESTTVYYIEHEIMRNMTCNGRNLWDIMWGQMIQESTIPDNRTWELPIYLTVSALVLIIAILMAVFVRQQMIIHSELLNNSWLIIPEIVGNGSIGTLDPSRACNDGLETEEAIDSIFSPDRYANNICHGTYEDQVLTMIQMKVCKLKFTIRQKKVLLTLRNSINHVNVMRFIGLADSQSHLYTCHAGRVRITLTGLLQHSQITVKDGGNISIVKGIVSGMKYLHTKEIVHGNLCAENIFVDMAWNIRIAGWIETYVAIQENASGHNRVEPCNACLQLNENQTGTSLFWTAPEILKYGRNPVYSSDIYSFGMVLQEIFSRRELYDELGLPPKEVIGAVLTCGIRPKFYPNTPAVIRSLMERCWDMDSAQRPTFHAVDNLLKNEFPKQTHLLDTIIESLQRYTTDLKRELAESHREAVNIKKRLHAQITFYLPESLAGTLIAGQQIEANTFDEATVMAFQITNLPQIIGRATSKGVVNILNKLYNSIDLAIADKEVQKINRFVFYDLYVSGLPEPNDRHAATMCHCALRIVSSVDEFSNDHLSGMDRILTIAIAVASGSLLAGVLGKTVAQYFVIGQPLTEAVHLLANTRPGSIQLAKQTYTLVKNERSLVTNVYQTLKGTDFVLKGNTE